MPAEQIRPSMPLTLLWSGKKHPEQSPLAPSEVQCAMNTNVQAGTFSLMESAILEDFLSLCQRVVSLGMEIREFRARMGAAAGSPAMIERDIDCLDRITSVFEELSGSWRKLT